jgi:hypothetical protein
VLPALWQVARLFQRLLLSKCGLKQVEEKTIQKQKHHLVLSMKKKKYSIQQIIELTGLTTKQINLIKTK